MDDVRRVVVSLPLRTRFRGLLHRETMLVEGPAGWGEFAAFAEYDDEVAAPWWDAAREAATLGFPRPVRDVVPVNVIVPACDPATATALVSESGCRTAKVKVAEPGQAESDDLARLEAVRAALPPGGRVRMDANAAWDLDTALARLPRYDRAAGGLEYVEQPCATVPELAAVRRRQHVPVAADESVRRAADPLAVATAEAADVVVLKVPPLGGVRPALALAERIGLPVVVSSALESSVGMAAGVALAAALPELPYDCGLASAALFAHDVVADPMRPVDGVLAVRRPAPDPAALGALRVPSDREAWWKARADRLSKRV